MVVDEGEEVVAEEGDWLRWGVDVGCAPMVQGLDKSDLFGWPMV